MTKPIDALTIDTKCSKCIAIHLPDAVPYFACDYDPLTHCADMCTITDALICPRLKSFKDKQAPVYQAAQERGESVTMERVEINVAQLDFLMLRLHKLTSVKRVVLSVPDCETLNVEMDGHDPIILSTSSEHPTSV
jgi:hypothetical protein